MTSTTLTGPARNLQTHYNIAPTDIVDVVKLADGDTRELVPMRWGLIPYWWKKPLKQLPATFNARAEGVASKPMFRDAVLDLSPRGDAERRGVAGSRPGAGVRTAHGLHALRNRRC